MAIACTLSHPRAALSWPPPQLSLTSVLSEWLAQRSLMASQQTNAMSVSSPTDQDLLFLPSMHPLNQIPKQGRKVVNGLGREQRRNGGVS